MARIENDTRVLGEIRRIWGRRKVRFGKGSTSRITLPSGKTYVVRRDP